MAQVAMPTPAPRVTAAGAPWQMNGEPLYFAGNFYSPTGPSTFFDGKVMVQSGVYKGVPFYQDRTIEPYSKVFVPIGGTVMRPYGRRGALGRAGTVGLPTPSAEPAGLSEVPGPVGTVGTETSRTSATSAAIRPQPMRLESIPSPVGTRGVWIDYSGARRYLAGQAVPYDAGRFTPVGSYKGFPVYRDTKGAGDMIWVSVVANGPLAPYSTR